MLDKDDLKAILDTISPYVDARAKTTELFLKAEITSVKADIKSSEERLGTEILATRAEAKTQLSTIDAKLVKKVNSHERRIGELEEKAGLPNPDKN